MKEKLGVNYGKLWFSSAISNLGDGIALVAYPWLASSVTRDPIEIALIAVAARLPWLFFTLPAGVIIDRNDRRKLVGYVDIFRAFLTLGVAFVVFLSPALPTPEALAAGIADEPAGKTALLLVLYGSAFMFGMAEVLRDSAAQTLLPSIVERTQLQKANGRLWSASMLMNSFVGRPLAGVLIAASLSLPFFVDATTFAISAFLILSIHGNFKSQTTQSQPVKSHWLQEMKTGVAWLWQRPFLRDLALLLGVMNAINMLALATYILYVQEILNLSASQFGWLMTAGAIGGAIGSFYSSRITSSIGTGPALSLAVGLTFIQFAVTGFTSNAILVWAVFLFGSFGAMLWNVITVSLRQQIIPNEILGRVTSTYRFFGLGMMPIGTLLGGVMVDFVGTVATRELALRVPFYFSAAVYLLLLLFVATRMTTDKIKAESTAIEDNP